MIQIERIVTGPLATNGYLVADDDGTALVLDPGYEPERFDERARRLGWRIAAVVITHGHFDHVSGVAAGLQMWSVPLYMHHDAAPLATTASQHAMLFGMPAEDCPPPDHTLAHGDRLTIGRLEFEIRHTPGHSPGGMCLYTRGHCFTGDTLFASGIGRTDGLPEADFDALMTSIREQLMTLPDGTVIYPGHGETSSIGIERRMNPYRFDWSPAQ